MLQAPIVWAQRKDKVLATINIQNIKDAVLDVQGSKFTFSGKVEDKTYQCEVVLFSEIDEKESHYVVRPRGIEIALKKKDESIWWPRLAEQSGRLHWITVDWNRWVDSSDDEDAKPDFNWDPSEMGGFGGYGDGDGEEDDEDDMEPVAPEAGEEPAAE